MNRRAGFGDTAARPQRPSRLGRSSPFVGRDEEMRRLTAALTLAAEAEGSTIFLTGQPGIGKTRLAREALALAKAQGLTVLEGRAFPLQAGLAYAPFIDALGPLLRCSDSAHLDSLVGGLPSLGRIFEGLPVPVPSFSEGLGDPAVEKTRLFEAVSRLLERLTRDAPVAFLVDDLDRADTASVELFAYIARGISDQRVLLLATYCSDATAASSGLRTLTFEMKRSGLAQEIVVARLRSDLVDKLARGILGGEAPSELLTLLDGRAAGTPFFVETLITGLIDCGNLTSTPHGWVLNAKEANTIPPSVRDLILERLERLAATDRRVLDLIAVMGRTTSHAVLRAASRLEEDPLAESLRRLRIAGLVAKTTEGSDVAYGISHPLVQEVAYAELPETTRRRAHMAIVEALESFPDGRLDDVNRLARHYHGAGFEADPGRALSTLVAAGDRALAVYANEEAVRHYAAALAMLREGGGSMGLPLHPPPSTLAKVLERLGEAYERTGKRTAAIELWTKALGLLSVEQEPADPSTDRTVAIARLRRRLALAEFERGQFDVAKAHLSAGRVLLTDGTVLHSNDEPCQELAELLFTRFQILSRLQDVTGMVETAAELLLTAQRLGSPRAEAQAHIVASISCLWQHDAARAREHASHALMIGESFSEGQDLAICCRAHEALVFLGMYVGDHRFVRHHGEQGLAIAQRLGAPSSEVVLRLRLAYAYFLSGAW
ncbi:MAG: AAA family ATPase, partial [Dehalococcoidia bacterium]|nr:AAA family ATPase [Dehalococcoidia bacterium]